MKLDLYDLNYLREIINNYCDSYGGFALYWHDELIAHLYFRDDDCPRTFYHVLCENITPEEIEELFDQDIFQDENCYLINHLTGTKIPNEFVKINYGFIINGFSCLRLSIGVKERPIYFDIARDLHDFCAMVFYTGVFSLRSIISFPTSISKIYTNILHLWSERLKRNIENHSKKYLVTQNKVVVDLRRGKFEWMEPNERFQYLGTDEAENFTTAYCPLKKCFLEHVNEIILALPGESHSKYYCELLACIVPEKVIELVVFNPIALGDFYIFNNIQKLCLIDMEQNIDMSNISLFQRLKKIYIVCENDRILVDTFSKIPNDIQLEIVCLEGYSTIIKRNYD